MASPRSANPVAVPGRVAYVPGSDAPRLSDKDFQRELLQVVPELRAFAQSLTRNPDSARDLVQDALIRAWAARARFQANTNMRAWTFSILRNRHRSLWWRSRRMAEWSEEAESKLSTPAPQHGPLDLQDMHRAMLKLPLQQREALILVGAGGLSHEEAAEICRCAVGTIKSRVSRAR